MLAILVDAYIVAGLLVHMKTSWRAMEPKVNKLINAVIEFFILTFLALLPILSIYIDVIIIGNNVGEISVTEFMQEALLLISAVVFWYGA